MGGIVQNVAAILGAHLFYDQRGAGIDTFNQEGTCAVGGELAVGITHHGAIRGGDEELYVGQGFLRHTVDLFDQQSALGRVAEVQLYHILILAADIGGLGRSVNDVAAVTGQFLHDIGAFIEPSDGEASAGRSLIGANDCTAGAGSAGEVLDLEYGVLHSLSGDGIKLEDNQRAERSILESNNLALAGLDEDFLHGRIFDPIPGHRLQFSDFVPAIFQVGDLELAVLVGIEIAEVIDLAAFGIVAGIGHLELCTLQWLTRDAANLIDSQAGLLMVFKVHRVVAVGIESHKLTGSIQQIRGRNRLLGNLIDAGKQVLQLCTAVRSGADLIDAVAVSGTDDEYGVGDGLAGVGIVLVNVEVGADLVLDDQRTCLAGEQLHLVLTQVDDVIRHRGRFTYGKDSGLQIADQNLAVFVGGAVEVMCPILDFCNPESHTLQRRTIGTELDDLQRGFDAVGEYELGVLVGVQLNDALGFINDIAWAGQFRYHIGAGRELAQVDLAVFIGTELFGAVVTGNGLNLKQDIGDDLGGIGAVNLHQTQARLDVVEEHQFLNTIARFQFHFLGGGVEDMPVTTRIHFHGSVGAGLHIGQQDLTELVCPEGAQRDAVAPDLKGDIGHGDHILAVILDDTQAGQLFVDQMEGSSFTSYHVGGIDCVVQQPSRRGRRFLDSVSAGLDLVKHGHARRIGLRRVSFSAFNVGD